MWELNALGMADCEKVDPTPEAVIHDLAMYKKGLTCSSSVDPTASTKSIDAPAGSTTKAGNTNDPAGSLRNRGKR